MGSLQAHEVRLNRSTEKRDEKAFQANSYNSESRKPANRGGYHDHGHGRGRGNADI